MRTYLNRGGVALAVVLAVSVPAFAQSIIRAKVVDAAGQPIEGATVLIEAAEGSRRVELTTDRDGEVLQTDLPSGQYNVTASKDGMQQTWTATLTEERAADFEVELSPARRGLQAMAQSAEAAMRAGDDEGALQQFNELLAKEPTCADCYYNVGLIYSKQQRYAEAEATFKRVTELRPDSADGFTGLATVYNAQERFDLAAEASEKASSLSGEAGGAEAAYNNGVILWNARKYAEAKTQFEAAAKADPNLAMAHYQLGIVDLNLGQIPEAREAFANYLKVEPNGPKAAEVKTFLEQLPQ